MNRRFLFRRRFGLWSRLRRFFRRRRRCSRPSLLSISRSFCLLSEGNFEGKEEKTNQPQDFFHFFSQQRIYAPAVDPFASGRNCTPKHPASLSRKKEEVMGNNATAKILGAGRELGREQGSKGEGTAETQFVNPELLTHGQTTPPYNIAEGDADDFTDAPSTRSSWHRPEIVHHNARTQLLSTTASVPQHWQAHFRARCGQLFLLRTEPHRCRLLPLTRR